MKVIGFYTEDEPKDRQTLIVIDQPETYAYSRYWGIIISNQAYPSSWKKRKISHPGERLGYLAKLWRAGFERAAQN